MNEATTPARSAYFWHDVLPPGFMVKRLRQFGPSNPAIQPKGPDDPLPIFVTLIYRCDFQSSEEQQIHKQNVEQVLNVYKQAAATHRREHGDANERYFRVGWSDDVFIYMFDQRLDDADELARDYTRLFSWDRYECHSRCYILRKPTYAEHRFEGAEARIYLHNPSRLVTTCQNETRIWNIVRSNNRPEVQEAIPNENVEAQEANPGEGVEAREADPKENVESHDHIDPALSAMV